MPRGFAVIGLPLGFMVAIIDCWLSMQSMFGILHPTKPVEWVVAVTVGFTLTAVAVCAPIVKGALRSPFAKFIWFIILLIDIGTSILGAIWYGVMKQDWSSHVDVTRIRYDPTRTMETGAFVGFVLLVAFGCGVLGWSMRELARRRHNQDV